MSAFCLCCDVGIAALWYLKQREYVCVCPLPQRLGFVFFFIHFLLLNLKNVGFPENPTQSCESSQGLPCCCRCLGGCKLCVLPVCVCPRPLQDSKAQRWRTGRLTIFCFVQESKVPTRTGSAVLRHKRASVRSNVTCTIGPPVAQVVFGLRAHNTCTREEVTLSPMSHVLLSFTSTHSLTHTLTT